MFSTQIRITQKVDKLTKGVVYDVHGVTLMSRFVFNDEADPVFLYDIQYYEWVD